MNIVEKLENYITIENNNIITLMKEKDICQYLSLSDLVHYLENQGLALERIKEDIKNDKGYLLLKNKNIDLKIQYSSFFESTKELCISFIFTEKNMNYVINSNANKEYTFKATDLSNPENTVVYTIKQKEIVLFKSEDIYILEEEYKLFFKKIMDNYGTTKKEIIDIIMLETDLEIKENEYIDDMVNIVHAFNKTLNKN